MAQAWKKNQMHMVSVEQMTDEAIEFIRKYEPEEGYFVAFSGGKDSIVTLELVRMAGVEHKAFYSATGIDPPELSKFIKKEYPEVTWLKPKLNFYEGVRTKHPPMIKRRWCCDYLKKYPSKHINLNNRILGVRAEESFARKQRGDIQNFSGKQTLYCPIFNWKTWHVWEFIATHKLLYPALYDDGWERIGCIICPFICRKDRKLVDLHRARWPKQYAAFDRAVFDWWETKAKHNGSKKDFKTVDEYLAAWYRGFE